MPKILTGRLNFCCERTRIQYINQDKPNITHRPKQRKMTTNNFLKYFPKMDRLMMMMIYEFILLEMPL